MKKTLSVNLGGSVYNIDEDAYFELMDYLQDVKSHLGDDSSSEEVLNDVEQRISELFMQWMQGKREVITLADVRKVIGVLGRPEQFNEEEEEVGADSGKSGKQTDQDKISGSGRRKWYRDTENAVLGGVCSGLAVYLNVSVVLIRILFVLCLWFWFTGLLFYILCWIIVPEAKTAAQRLEMLGEDVTIDNIEKKVRQEYEKVRDRADGYVKSERFQQNMRTAESGFMRVIQVLAKVFMALITAVFVLTALGILVGLVVSLVAIWGGASWLVFSPGCDFPFQQLFMDPVPATFVSIGLLLVLGIPFFALFRLLFGSFLNLKPARAWEFWVGLLFWFIGIGLCTYLGMQCWTGDNCQLFI